MLRTTPSRLLRLSLTKKGHVFDHLSMYNLKQGLVETKSIIKQPDHPAGIKTSFFWAPAWKWMLVFVGIGEWFRPAEKLSMKQNFSLMCTGLIWARYSMQILPKNYLLYSVNLMLGVVGIVQVGRISSYQVEKGVFPSW